MLHLSATPVGPPLAKGRRAKPDLVAILWRRLPILGQSKPRSINRSRQEAASPMWNPPSPRSNATQNWSAIEGWRSRMVGRASAQLAQKALSLSLVALRMPKPPLDKEMLALVSHLLCSRNVQRGRTDNSILHCRGWSRNLETRRGCTTLKR